ncbi:MAG: YdcF family protein [Gemmatimonadetes bacterium]|nr:YdcF family protein [Gemmatimonadota bacterium]
MSEHVTAGVSPAAGQRKTGILVHGYNLNAERWESVAWGETPDRLGRVPLGVFVALCEQADVMVFGSGASRKNGMLESEATARLLRERFDELVGFSVFEKHLPELKHPDSSGLYRKQIESVLRLDTESQNTREEIAHAGRVFLDRGVERIILVSSPTHLPRCLRDACTIFEESRELSRLRHGLYAVPSVTGYVGYTAADVAIFEPPHRPDRSGSNISGVVARIHDIPESGRERFVRRLDDLLAEFKV